MNLENFKNDSWVKNWSGNWRAPFSSLYWLYTTNLEPYIGKNLETNLIICEKEVSSNYISKRELDIYCNYIADQVIKNSQLAIKWASDTILTAEELYKILNDIKTKDDITLSNLLRIKEKFYQHIPPHFSMKKVIDYLPEKLQKKLSHSLVEARLKTENLFNEVDKKLIDYTKFISEMTGYPNEITVFLTIDEIKIFLEKKELPSEEELFRRSNGMAIFYYGDKQELFLGQDFTKLKKILFNSQKTELKGNVGYPGKIQGTVRIVFDPFNVKTFNDGDILVTGMTRPEFLSLMKKSGAFVTDAGGLLCHAAIVARELKKPCIIGTEVATQVFKDGDLVEVDAEKGVVRKIK